MRIFLSILSLAVSIALRADDNAVIGEVRSADDARIAPDELCGLTMAVQQVSTILKQKLPGCIGVTLSCAEGEGAGQEVPHTHFHVIPRYLDDGFGWRRFGKATDRESLESLVSLIRLDAPRGKPPNRPLQPTAPSDRG